MASILHDDVELGLLLHYKEEVDGEKTIQNCLLGRCPRFFNFHFDKVTEDLATVASRLGFLRKVLGILSLQFFVTAVICRFFFSTWEIRFFLQQQLWIVLASTLLSFILLFAVFISARLVPLNYMLLASWIVMHSIAVGVAVSFFDAKIIIRAVGLIALTITSLFIYTLQSKRDFHKHWAMLFSASLIFLTACFMHPFTDSSLFEFLVATFGAILFSVYLIFGIDRIMRRISPEDYIKACASLYLDIISCS